MLSANDAMAKEQCALAHMKNHEFLQASLLLREIVTAYPNWEHGGAAYSLAICYDALGNLADADRCYQLALSYRPNDHLFWGAYSEFLYCHGDPKAALDALLKYIACREFSTALLEECLPEIKVLCEKQGLTELQTNALIDGLRATSSQRHPVDAGNGGQGNP